MVTLDLKIGGIGLENALIHSKIVSEGKEILDFSLGDLLGCVQTQVISPTGPQRANGLAVQEVGRAALELGCSRCHQ